MTRKSMQWILVGLTVVGMAAAARADDWPTYRRDIRRSGVSTETVRAPLSRAWVFTPTYPPRHAWGDPQAKPIERVLELPRMRFDDAFHVAAVGEMVYFGSSADGKVYALDAATGEVRWEFYTDGPVRLAPTVAGGKVYVGSDDGKVYCIDAATGKAVWTFTAAATGEKVIGNAKMISIRPVRTGVAVDGGVAYFGAGVFPAEGLYLYAVGAADGKLLWKNESYAQTTRGSLAPQGYLLASADKLFVPSSRTMPGAFDRADGRFLFQRSLSWRRSGLFGGTYATLAGGVLYVPAEQVVAVGAGDGQLVGTEGLAAAVPSTGLRRLAVDGETAYLLNGKHAIAFDPKGWLTTGKRRPAPKTKWRIECASHDSIALTAKLVFVGGQDVVQALDRADGREVWSAKVAGRARGLAVANGRVLASMDTGEIHCFVAGAGGKGAKVAPKITADVFAKDDRTALWSKTAEHIVKQSGVTRGFALILGQADAGRLALELARRSELLTYIVEPDAAKVAAARKALSAAGVYGEKVVVVQGQPAATSMSSYFANVIVCGPDCAPAAEVARMLKPCGGVAYVRKPGGAWLGDFRKALDDLAAAPATVGGDDRWAVLRRGALRGAGSWTHQYAEPGNTICGDDRLVKGAIGLLWFGEPGPGRMPSRHASNSAPLSIGGRMFVQGENVIMAHDAYNGVQLWQREIRGALRVGLKNGCSNLAASADSLFVAVADQCLRLDAATGKTIKTYTAPPDTDGKKRTWYYVATVGDLLYGSAGNAVFAVEIASGKPRWRHEGGKIMPPTICIADGRLFFVDRTTTPDQRARGLKEVPLERRVDRRGKAIRPDVRLAVALDAGSGKQLWASPQYVSDCVGISKAGGELVAMAKSGVVLLCGQPWNGHFWSEFFAGEFSRRSLIALSAEDGRMLWSGRKGYRSRPLIVGDRIVAEPWAHDLRTGRETKRVHPITGADALWQMARPGHHCGNIAASPNALFYRSGVSAYYDLIGDYGTAHLGGIRPGCWVNCIPANGLVLMPEASSGCVCPFPLHCTIALAPKKASRVWGMFSAPGPMTPVKRLAVNLGAPGDRRDSAGNLWLAYPRPYTGRLVVDLPVQAQGGSYFRGAADAPAVSGTADAWIYASGSVGLRHCRVPVTHEDEAPGVYTVRLYFAEPLGGQAGRRVFDIKLQGRTVAESFDVAKAAGGPAKAVVREFKNIEITQALTIELTAKLPKPRADQMPILQGVELIRQRVLRLGVGISAFVLDSGRPKRTGELTVANFKPADFAGRVSITAPDAFAFTPASAKLTLPTGRRAALKLTAAVVKEIKPGKYPVEIKLTRADGGVECTVKREIEYLGKRARMTVKAVEDTHAQKMVAATPQGAALAINVDGGDRKLGDHHHSIAYLKFNLKIPGKPISAALRLYNAGNPTGNSGQVRVVTENWTQRQLTYNARPKLGEVVATIGPVEANQVVTLPLKLTLPRSGTLSLAIDPTGNDGVDYVSREGGKPAELIIEYEP